MSDTKYSGWTNYETWNAALWMGNDGSEYWGETAQAIYDRTEADNGFTHEENASRELAELMEAEFEEYASEWMSDQASFFADILNAGLAAVNWNEIAAHLIDDCEKDESEADEQEPESIEAPDVAQFDKDHPAS